MNISDTPLRLVQKWTQMIPGCYDTLDSASSDMECPTGCIPIGLAMALLVNKGLSQSEASSIAAELVACYTWRQRKIIFDFDETLAESLNRQGDEWKDTAELPTDIMLHPPYPCVYIKAPVASDIVGFFAWIEYDPDKAIYEFRANFMHKSYENTYPQQIELIAPTLGECLSKTMQTTIDNMRNLGHDVNASVTDLARQFYSPIVRALQFYLYLCSDKPDVTPDPQTSKTYRPRKVGGRILDKFREIEGKKVGVVIGSAIRLNTNKNSDISSSSVSPHKSHKPHRPHTRRGHWHHYWIGKRGTQERKLILKWTHPMLVGAPELAADIEVRPVK